MAILPCDQPPRGKRNLESVRRTYYDDRNGAGRKYRSRNARARALALRRSLRAQAFALRAAGLDRPHDRQLARRRVAARGALSFRRRAAERSEERRVGK